MLTECGHAYCADCVAELLTKATKCGVCKKPLRAGGMYAVKSVVSEAMQRPAAFIVHVCYSTHSSDLLFVMCAWSCVVACFHAGRGGELVLRTAQPRQRTWLLLQN